MVEDPKYLKLNVDMKETIVATTNKLFKEFIDVFSWNYKALRGISSPFMIGVPKRNV